VLGWHDDLIFDDQAGGITNRRTGEIQLDPKHSAPARILIHELLHAAEDGMEDSVNHDTLDRLAAGLTDAFMSEPRLLDWIAEQVRRQGER
jgi:hypothetical protein